MHHSDGLTLVEVLVALVILAVGVIAAASMQTTALSTTSRATISQQLTKLANAEIEMQHQLAAPVDKKTCLSGHVSEEYDCETTVVPCSVSSTSPATPSIRCLSGTTPVVAYRTTVDVTGPRSTTLTLTSLIPFEPSP